MPRCVGDFGENSAQSWTNWRHLRRSVILSFSSEARLSKNWAGTCHPPSPLYVSRAAALAAGIPETVPISTVNRLCSSGLQAIRSIAHAIEAGEISLGVAVGVESMSLKYDLIWVALSEELTMTKSAPYSRSC